MKAVEPSESGSRWRDCLRRKPGSRIHKLLAYSLHFALAGFVLLSLVHLVVYVAARIPRLDEIGYGDSYVLFDTLRSARTGTIYPDLSAPPYLPAQYGPWLYLLHSWPAGISPSWNPFLGPRILSLLSFSCCLFFVYRTAHSLWKNRVIAFWSVTLAASCAVMADWVLQLRSDFFAASCSIAAIWLLLKGKRWGIALAGVLAASAIVFKLTMAAAVGAGFLWFLSRKRFRECLIFTSASAAFLLACYLYFARTEPRMIQQLLAASPPVIDYRYYWELILARVMREPVLWLAFTAAPIIYLGRRVALLAIFAAISFLIALLTDLQAGGNVNYFYEFLFALAPLAGWAAVALSRAARNQPAVSLFAAGVFLIGPVYPVAKAVVEQVREFASIQRYNRPVELSQQFIQGKRFFSTVPRLALMSPSPQLMEPWTLSIWRIQGKTDASPWTVPIERGDYEVIVTSNITAGWRGIRLIDGRLLRAIQSRYSPYCRLGDYWYHLPAADGTDKLKGSLDRIGCRPVHDQRQSGEGFR